MADIKFKTVQVAIPVASGSFDVTIAGFGTPKGAILELVNATTNNVQNADRIIGRGYIDGTREQSITTVSNDGNNPVEAQRIMRSDRAIMLAERNTAAFIRYDVLVDFNGWITDGVRLDNTITPNNSYLLNVTLIGGAGVTNVFASTRLLDVIPSSTNIGFEPDVAFFTTVGSPTLGSDEIHNLLSTGIAINDGADTQYCLTSFDEDGTTRQDSGSYLSDTSASVGQYFNGTVNWEAGVSFNSTGWSYTGTEGNDVIMYLAVKFDGTQQMSLGDVTTPTTTGNATLGSSTFTPEYMYMVTSKLSATDVGENAVNTNFMMLDDTNQIGCTILSGDDSFSPHNKSRCTSGKLTLEDFAIDNTVLLDANFVDFQATGARFNFTTADAIARLGFAFSIANAATGGINVDVPQVTATNLVYNPELAQASFIDANRVDATPVVYQQTVLVGGLILAQLITGQTLVYNPSFEEDQAIDALQVEATPFVYLPEIVGSQVVDFETTEGQTVVYTPSIETPLVIDAQLVNSNTFVLGFSINDNVPPIFVLSRVISNPIGSLISRVIS